MGSDFLVRVRDEVGNLVGAETPRLTGLYFFLSLDLVNSTAYKAHNEDWKILIRMFYDEAKSFFTNHMGSLRPRTWKYAGDEVLFYQRMRSISELEGAVKTSYAALQRVCTTVENWTQEKSPRLYVKATCWVAHAEHLSPAPAESVRESKHRNIVFQSPLGGGAPILDFLGPDIDAGFRATGTSLKKALVVSAELAALLHSQGVREVGDKLRVIDYRELKGVWDGRLYPVVWYRDDWGHEALDLDYAYDDRFRYDLLSKAYSAAGADDAKRLPAIVEQVKRDWLTELSLPRETPPNAPDDPLGDAPLSLGANVEVHCVAVCFAPDGRVLIARRGDKKRVYPNAWEVGCAKLQPGDDFASALKRDYRMDFGIDLSFDDEPLRPIGTYSFVKNATTIPGVIFVATVLSPDQLKAHKHAEAKWVDPVSIPSGVTSECVPDLTERIERAAKVWSEGRSKAVHARAESAT